jgi:hypothetical protein
MMNFGSFQIKWFDLADSKKKKLRELKMNWAEFGMADMLDDPSAALISVLQETCTSTTMHHA